MNRTAVLRRFLGQCDFREELNAPIPLESGWLVYTNGHVIAAVPHKVTGVLRKRSSALVERIELYLDAASTCDYEPIGDIDWPDETICLTCRGTGQRRLCKCAACMGTGVMCDSCHGDGLVVVVCDDRTCPACVGCGIWPWPIWRNVDVCYYYVYLLGFRFDAKYVRLLLDLAGDAPLEVAMGVATDGPDGLPPLFWRAGDALGVLMPRC